MRVATRSMFEKRLTALLRKSASVSEHRKEWIIGNDVPFGEICEAD